MLPSHQSFLLFYWNASPVAFIHYLSKNEGKKIPKGRTGFKILIPEKNTAFITFSIGCNFNYIQFYWIQN